MSRIQEKRLAEERAMSRDGSVDSALTKSAASMLESVEAYLAQHPDLNGVGRIPARKERGTSAGMKLEA